jgi:hypothetical protein
MAPTTDATPVHIHTYTLFCPSLFFPAQNTPPAIQSVAWPSNNLALLVPLALPFSYSVKRVFWFNGAVAGANIDCGIYTSAFGRVASTGSVAMAGTNVAQYASLVTTLAPGTYYLALACSSAAAGTFGSNSIAATTLEHHGGLQMAAALPLPATITPAAPTAAFWPLIGITRSSSGF